MGELLARWLRSIGGDGAAANARAELVRDQERSVQAEVVIRRVNHTQAPLRPKVVAASDRRGHRTRLARAA